MTQKLPGYTFRAATPADEPFLWEMLYQAVHVPAGAPPPPRTVLQEPSLAHYVADWGKRLGDQGIIAVQEASGEAVGAVWLRLFTADAPGWGYVDERTPELSIAVVAGQRSQGLGRVLIERLVEEARGTYPALSLSVDPHNAAFRLYQRLGFQEVGMSGTSVTMRKELRVSADDLATELAGNF
jgi:ribosomal protein S18 acetylase RimI-like enzyme